MEKKEKGLIPKTIKIICEIWNTEICEIWNTSICEITNKFILLRLYVYFLKFHSMVKNICS